MREETRDDWRGVLVRRLEGEKRADVGELFSLPCFHQGETLVLRDKAIGRLANFSPKDDRFLAVLDCRRLILVRERAKDLCSATSKVKKFDTRMEFKSNARPIFDANVTQCVDS